MLQGRDKMIKASHTLPAIPSHQDGLQIYFLTGKDYLYQTLFCAYSLVKFSKEKYQFTLVDDGSFTEDLKSRTKKQMPGVIILDTNQINRNLDLFLPIHNYPFLQNKRTVYPHLRKLTDVHTIDDGYKLVLDSDMLFFKEPTEMIDWLKAPSGSLFMVDCAESYGYSQQLMEDLVGEQIPKLVNVGTFGFNSSAISWQQMENWGKNLEEKEGTTYFLEQALSAMLVANRSKTILNKEEYVVNPSQNLENAKLHHYVDLSKKFYWETAWKIIHE